MNQSQGRVAVISGPTAVGKGTVVGLLQDQYPEAYVSVSATTRPPRAGEVDGQHYFFVSDDEFDDLIAHDGLLEWAEVHRSARYGTPRRAVEEAVGQGRTVILEIDLQGARQVRRSMPEALSIFLAPPSLDELVRRLRGRGTETPEQQQTRLRTAAEEMAAQQEFDVVVVNEDLGKTVDRLVELLSL